jgi:hypothetical protein
VFGYVVAGDDVGELLGGLNRPLLRLVLPGRYPPYVPLEVPLAVPMVDPEPLLVPYVLYCEEAPYAAASP